MDQKSFAALFEEIDWNEKSNQTDEEEKNKTEDWLTWRLPENIKVDVSGREKKKRQATEPEVDGKQSWTSETALKRQKHRNGAEQGRERERERNGKMRVCQVNEQENVNKIFKSCSD